MTNAHLVKKLEKLAKKAESSTARCRLMLQTLIQAIKSEQKEK